MFYYIHVYATISGTQGATQTRLQPITEFSGHELETNEHPCVCGKRGPASNMLEKPVPAACMIETYTHASLTDVNCQVSNTLSTACGGMQVGLTPHTSQG